MFSWVRCRTFVAAAGDAAVVGGGWGDGNEPAADGVLPDGRRWRRPSPERPRRSTGRSPRSPTRSRPWRSRSAGPAERMPRGVRLTPMGRAFRPHAELAVRSAAQPAARPAPPPGSRAGNHIAAGALGRRRHPARRLRPPGAPRTPVSCCTSTSTRRPRHWGGGRARDRGPRRRPDAPDWPGTVVTVGEEEIVLVVPFDDRFAGRTTVTLPELADWPWVGAPWNPSSRANASSTGRADRRFPAVHRRLHRAHVDGRADGRRRRRLHGALAHRGRQRPAGLRGPDARPALATRPGGLRAGTARRRRRGLRRPPAPDVAGPGTHRPAHLTGPPGRHLRHPGLGAGLTPRPARPPPTARGRAAGIRPRGRPWGSSVPGPVRPDAQRRGSFAGARPPTFSPRGSSAPTLRPGVRLPRSASAPHVQPRRPSTARPSAPVPVRLAPVRPVARSPAPVPRRSAPGPSAPAPVHLPLVRPDAQPPPPSSAPTRSSSATGTPAKRSSTRACPVNWRPGVRASAQRPGGRGSAVSCQPPASASRGDSRVTAVTTARSGRTPRSAAA